jgi:hypothetical protein
MRIPLALIVCIGLFAACAIADEASVLLTIKPVYDDFFNKASDGHCPDLNGMDDALFIVGTFNPPTFSVKSTDNMALSAADGTPISMIIDKSSLYSEFEGAGINSMRFAFVISEKVLAKGAPTLKWGSDIAANNSEVEEIIIFNGDKQRYRTFSWEERLKNSEGPYVATIEVIVDDYADTYYLWYLMPMALIFGLLFFKKALLR